MRGISGVLHRLPKPSVTMSPSVTLGDLVISFDGRIDDRAGLAAALSLPSSASDATLIAAAYKRWGDDFLAHVLGNFALALWDARAHRLLLSRDYIGVLPLYYHRTPEAITWSSRLQPIIDSTACSREPDRHFMAGFLTRGGGRLDVSPYAAIAAVPPAVLVLFTRDRQTTYTWWRLEPEREIRLASDAEYEERFYATFRSAVSDCLPAEGTIFAEMSGGVDSTSIIAVADEMLRAAHRPARSLQTVSHIYEALTLSDDRPFQAIVQKAFGRPAHYVDERDAPFFAWLGEEYPFEAPTAYWAGAAIMAGVHRTMANENSRVILCGAGGDHLSYSEVEIPPSVADHLAALRFGQALRESRIWAGALSSSQTKILRSSVRQAVAARLGFGEREPSVPPWINRRFAHETAIDKPSRRSADVENYRIPSRRAQVYALRDLSSAFEDRHFFDPNVDVRYPYADRRLVELAFGIPIEQHLRPGETRSLQRRSLARVVPPEIAWRRTKGGPSVAIYARFRQRWRDIKPLLGDMRVCDRGYIDPRPLADALHRAAHGQNVNAVALLRVLALEFWLRKLEQPALAAGRPQRVQTQS